MNAYLEARKSIRFLSSSLRGLAALDDMLGEAGTLEKTIAMGKAQLADMEVLRSVALAGADKAKASAAQIIADANADAEMIRDNAKQVMERAVAAEAEAQTVLAAARDEAASLVEAGRQEAAVVAVDTKGRLGALRKDVAASEAAKAALVADIAALNDQREEIEAHIADLKKRFG